MSDKANRGGGSAKTAKSNWPRSLLLSVWFTLVAIGFWGPYLHLPISPALLTGLYGIYVLIAAASATLGLLRHRGDEARSGG